GGTLHLDFAGFGFTRHGLAPSSPWLRQPFSACSQASSQPRRIDAAYTRVAGLSVGHLASALLLHLGGPRSARSLNIAVIEAPLRGSARPGGLSRAAGASKIRFVIASGCEISARWLASISIVFAPIRLAMKRSRSGLIVRSWVDTA